MSFYIICTATIEPHVVAGPFWTMEGAQEALHRDYADTPCEVVERADNIDFAEITRSVASG